jgi:UDP-glucose 4-epimerase
VKKSILVVGGAGYIGSNVALDLQQQGYSVIVLDNLSTGHRQAVGDCQFILGDARDKELLERVIETHPIDTIMHFAANTSVPESLTYPLKYYDNNTLSTLKLLQICEKYKIKKFVFSSTAAIYGDTPFEPITEAHIANPVTPYGKSKLMAEKICKDFSDAFGLNYVIFRYFNVAGANNTKKLGQRNSKAEHLIHVALQVALKQQGSFPLFGDDYNTPDGSCIRDFIHVSDLSSAHICAQRYLDEGGNSITLNCGYGHGYSVKEIISTLEEIIGEAIPVEIKERRPGDCPMVIADNEKIQQILGWQAKFDNINEILRSSLAWEQEKLSTAHQATI